MSEGLKELSDRATPGEWTVMPEINGTTDLTRIKIDGRTLARTSPMFSRPHVERNVSNAALIVALVNAYRRGELHDDTALASAEARARREALEEAAKVAGDDEWAIADTTGLRHLRIRLEGALAARREERDNESVAWLTAGVQALDDALIYAAERDRERRGRLIAEARYEPWRQESKRLEKELRTARARAASTAAEPRQTETGALAEIAGERRRQIEAEGWTPKHDDRHSDGALARAAAAYARHAGSDEDTRQVNSGFCPEDLWPFTTHWHPSTRHRDLVKAGALIVAEIERLDRAAPPVPALGSVGGERE